MTSKEKVIELLHMKAEDFETKPRQSVPLDERVDVIEDLILEIIGGDQS